MSKHDTILLTGMPGSQTGHLGESLAERLHSPLRSTEHVSLGNRIQAIGRGAVESLYGSHISRHLESRHPENLMDSEIIKGVVEEVFDEHRDTDLLFLSGYPRSPTQVSDALSTARHYRRLIRGIIATQTDELTATTRMLEQDGYPTTLDEAKAELEMYRITSHDTVEAIGRRGLLLARVDTTGAKADTDTQGLRALATMLSPNFVELAS